MRRSDDRVRIPPPIVAVLGVSAGPALGGAEIAFSKPMVILAVLASALFLGVVGWNALDRDIDTTDLPTEIRQRTSNPEYPRVVCGGLASMSGGIVAGLAAHLTRTPS